MKSQILTQEHDVAVMNIIRANVDDYDELNDSAEEEEDDDDEDDELVEKNPRVQRNPGGPISIGDHIVFGAPQKPVSLADLASSSQVCKDLQTLLNYYFEDMGIKTSDGHIVEVTPQHKVQYLFNMPVIY